jgi:hypothetical protein
MPQSPFQQSHPNTSAAQASAVAAAAAAQQHLPVYQHSPYTVHPLPPHSGYATAADHGALQYAPTMHHPHSGRWLNLNSMETDDGMLNKYRQDDPEPDYEMDHQSQDHPQQQQPQHMQQMQAPSASHESQTHASLQSLPPIAAVSNQPEQMSPATRPTGIRTGKFFTPLLIIFCADHDYYRTAKRSASRKQKQNTCTAEVVSRTKVGRSIFPFHVTYLIDPGGRVNRGIWARDQDKVWEKSSCTSTISVIPNK